MKKTLNFMKAVQIGDKEIHDTTIILKETFPDNANLKESDKLFELEATALENILINTLPGGTYDRLLGKMLQRKSSHFIVSHTGG